MRSSQLNSKKGVSPLIAWVLIIGFAIAMAGFIMGWAIPMVKRMDIEKGQEKELYCDGVQMSIDNACRYEGEVKLTVKNKGLYDITRITVSRETNASSLASCLILNVDDDYTSRPGETFELLIGVGGTIIKSQGLLQECSSFDLEGTSEILAYEVSLTPWVDIEGEQVSCSDKKVTINNRDILNTYCG